MAFCSDGTCERTNLKSAAFPVPKIIGGTQKIGKSLNTLTLPFLQIFSWAFVQMDPVIVLAKFEVSSFIRSWDNSDWSFVWGANPNLGEGEAVGVGMVPLERALVSSYSSLHPQSNFSCICTRFIDIAAFVLQVTTFFPPHL